jgi:hypothetical protein
MAHPDRLRFQLAIGESLLLPEQPMLKRVMDWIRPLVLPALVLR